MNTPTAQRQSAGIHLWATGFPYVNGGLFSGSLDAPRFSRIARSYLLHIGGLDWTKINPDIFGSMIQAVADDEERGALGMHYTSVPNILKVLNPLFLDDLREKLDEAGDNARKLLNLRNRMARIRVFDPACGSGNFLVIAYRQMRAIEAEINRRRGEPDRASDIPLTNFRGIELRDFPAEIARLALIIAEYQADVLLRGQKLALAEFLPLDRENWITRGNALRIDWLSICPPTGTCVKLHADDLFQSPLDQAQIDFENEGGETYICGNPPYVGKGKKSSSENADMTFLFDPFSIKHGYVDYAASWFLKAAVYARSTRCDFAFVVTNSICQGHQVPLFWPTIFRLGYRIRFAYPSFRWANLAANNAGVTVAIIGITRDRSATSRLYVTTSDDAVQARDVGYINAYLVPAENVIVEKRGSAPPGTAPMDLGNMPYDGGNLLMSTEERADLDLSQSQCSRLTRRIYGSQEYISGTPRYCLWIENIDLEEAMSVEKIAVRIEAVRQMRLRSPDKSANTMAQRAHQMREMRYAHAHTMLVPRTSSETRSHLPAGLLPAGQIVSSEAFALFDAPLWTLGLLLSRLHLVWVATVCGKLETRYRYSNVLGWNTFPVPTLTDKMKADLTRCAEDILLAREAHFPATIAELYDPERMDRDLSDLRAAHDRNDEVLERIYIGRRFKNDTERLEKLFELYTKMTGSKAKAGA